MIYLRNRLPGSLVFTSIGLAAISFLFQFQSAFADEDLSPKNFKTSLEQFTPEKLKQMPRRQVTLVRPNGLAISRLKQDSKLQAFAFSPEEEIVYEDLGSLEANPARIQAASLNSV